MTIKKPQALYGLWFLILLVVIQIDIVSVCTVKYGDVGLTLVDLQGSAVCVHKNDLRILGSLAVLYGNIFSAAYVVAVSFARCGNLYSQVCVKRTCVVTEKNDYVCKRKLVSVLVNVLFTVLPTFVGVGLCVVLEVR